jgi:hypothetical protein
MSNRPSGLPGRSALFGSGRLSLTLLFLGLLFLGLFFSLLRIPPARGEEASGVLDLGALPAAPESLVVADVPDDGGQTLHIAWKAGVGGKATGFAILRAETDKGPFAPIDTVAASATSFEDQAGPGHPLQDGKPYFYRISALGPVGETVSTAVSGIARQSFFHMGRLNLFLCIFVFFGLVLAFTRQAGQQAAQGKTPFVRKIAGLTAIEEAIGRATEMGRAVLYVPGIDDANNIQTIYSMIILGNVARTVARYETPLIVPVCRAFVVPLAEETVKQGYIDAGRASAFNRNNIRFLSEEQFAFTAGVDGIMLREKPAANLFLGSFFAESLILAETGFQTGAVQIAGTANIHQLPFFVVACDYTLIGEEFYAASAYLSRTPKLIGVLKGTDWMKMILIVLMLVGIVSASLGWDAFRSWFVIR